MNFFSTEASEKGQSLKFEYLGKDGLSHKVIGVIPNTESAERAATFLESFSFAVWRCIKEYPPKP